MNAAAIAQLLAGRIDQLASDLLPAGHREGHEWRCGSIAGEPGDSLGVHLNFPKAGVWADFSTEQRGDALDLVAAVLGKSMGEAIGWSRCWLGIGEGRAELPARSPSAKPIRPKSASDFWLRAWKGASPIAATPAETYLRTRGLQFEDREGRVLRFAECHPRRNAGGDIEHHPALIALLCDIRTGERAGTINVYIEPDGRDRLRDPKGKTSWGRAAGTVAMLSDFDEPTYGLVLAEGVETGISLLSASLAPVWCCGGAGNLAAFPVLNGIEALTIAADADEAGARAAETVAARWREAGREAVVIAPTVGDWADAHKEQAA